MLIIVIHGNNGISFYRNQEFIHRQPGYYEKVKIGVKNNITYGYTYKEDIVELISFTDRISFKSLTNITGIKDMAF